MRSVGGKRAGGYAHWFNGDGPDIERDTITCCHCGKVVFVPVRAVEDVTGWCMACMKFICKACEERGECLPLEKQFERIERAAR